jgi:hypothetical protein
MWGVVMRERPALISLGVQGRGKPWGNKGRFRNARCLQRSDPAY